MTFEQVMAAAFADELEKIAALTRQEKRWMDWPGKTIPAIHGTIVETGEEIVAPKHKIVPAHRAKAIARTASGAKVTDAPGGSSEVFERKNKEFRRFLRGRTLAYEHSRGTPWAKKTVDLLRSPSKLKRLLGRAMLQRYV